ncbi:MAG: hypothetical protein AAF517_10790 [Planctomycetota bacterium]
MIIMVGLVLVLMVLAAVGVSNSLSQAKAEHGRESAILANQIAESGASRALAMIKFGGIPDPVSGGGSDPEWISFSSGDFLFSGLTDPLTGSSVVQAWGRVAVESKPSIPVTILGVDETAVDDWADSGWIVRGVEITVQSSQYIPEVPLYFGNGGIERPLGGFDWNGTSDLADPSTWGRVSGSPSSYQDGSIPFEVSSLDHPIDYLYKGGTPAPVASWPHEYKVFSSQNEIGQFNIDAWFRNSAGSSSDPMDGVTPPPTQSFFEMKDKSSPDYPWPVESSVPDVQVFAWSLWQDFGAGYSGTEPVHHLTQGSRTGTYGDLNKPAVTFVTGGLTVPSGKKFEGAGILVIRDDYDPRTDTNNRPKTRAGLYIEGDFRWTGLVIVAGWAPTIWVKSGGDAAVVGALFGEDSVQSGGEVSLDSATITMRVDDKFRVLYSNTLFQAGGPINKFLPAVTRKVVGIRKL